MKEVLPNSISYVTFEAYSRADHQIQLKLQPLIDEVNLIRNHIHNYFLPTNPPNPYKFTETDILNYQYDPNIPKLSRSEQNSIRERDISRLADQYEHINKVLETTINLKRTLYEMDMPERTVAYQTGTGWPLPEETENCRKVGFIHYGDGSFKDYLPPGLEEDENAGIHIYRLRGKEGNDITLLVLKGRMHAYSETASPKAALDLAFMSRVLKGLGTELIFSSYASGIDPSLTKSNTYKKHDMAVIIGGADNSPYSSMFGPGTGDQRLIGPIFGGPFQNIAQMQPDPDHICLFIQAVNQIDSGLSKNDIRPNLHLTFATDTSRSPNFQDPWAQAATHSTYREVLKLGYLPKRILKLFKHPHLAVVHGMGQYVERDGYFQHSPEEWGIQTRWNRRLPELPIVTFTDFVDPGEHGQSQKISDVEVRKSGDEANPIIAKIITRFFELYAQTYS